MSSSRFSGRYFALCLVVAGLAAVTGCASPDAATKESIDSSESDLKLSSPQYLGQIADGETKTSNYRNPPRYRAYGFSASGGDEITASVKSLNGDAMGWITNSSYTVLAANDDASGSTLDSKVVYTVPAGTAKRAYRIVFRDYDLLDATFTVKVAVKTSASACDPNNEPYRDYKGTPTSCQFIRYSCPSSTFSFQNDCGCGCEDQIH
ncbi:MAG: hypothetical protein JWO86_4600 [Myxococcaceae bacterium]|nr:hypothetical protein [Myxococcaceae bacterium]MEA2749495.1 hypothetical protein [Myxococcales bacterium]